jgi:Beta-lactamase enzyme family
VRSKLGACLGAAALAAVLLPGHAVGASHPCVVPGFHKRLAKLWRPHMKAAIRYAHTRTGDIAFAVRTENNHYGYRPNHQEWSASIVKAMLLVAYISEPSVAHRKLTAYEKSVLGPMIRESNNYDAQIIYNRVGNSGLEALARRVGMTHFATNPSGIWGETLVTGRDQAKYFLHIDDYMPSSHRLYAMWLLNHIIPSERWGIAQVAPKGWRLYFKGGWGYGTGLIDSQVALLVRGCARVSVAVLTMHDGSHPYGMQTLRGAFSRLLRGLPRTK